LVAVASLVAAAAPVHAAPRGALLLMDVPAPSAPRVRKALDGRILDAATTKRIQADAAALGLGCPDLSDACAAGFGQVAGVDEVVVLTVRPRGRYRLVRAARVDARTARVVDVTIGRLGEKPGDGGVGVEAVAGNLFAKTKVPTLVPVAVVVTPEGTPIHIDGRPATLVDGDAWLLPGPHSLTVEGAAAASTTIVVTDRGDPGRVELTVVAPAPAASAPAAPTPIGPLIAEAEAPPSPSPWPGIVTWTGVGLGLLGGFTALGTEGYLAVEGNALAKKERTPIERFGVACFGVSVAGIVIAGVGVGLSWSTP
jgi:hypothetical protein